MSSREDWDRGQVLHAVGWMARRNGSGSSIYARPARSVLAHPWILVDDLDIHAKTRITEHHPPAAFVETSAGHWQAWLRLDHPLETDPRARVARWLAETYSRNPDTAAASPFGRLPGFTNQHPGRRQHDGLAPFTRLTDVHPEYAIGLDTLPASATPQITTPAREMRPDEPSRRTRARDQDFAIACRLVELGQHDPAIAAVLQAVRKHANVHHDDYIERTIAAPQRTRDNGSMTKSELIHRIAQKQSQIVERDVELAVKMMLDQMAACLAGGWRIEIRGVGGFSLRFRPARVGRNPRTGTPVSLPARYAPNFKPGKKLRERVNREYRGVADDTDGAGIIATRESGASFSPQER